MITKSQVKHIRSLDDKKYRKQHKQFIVEGEKMVMELIDSDFDVIQVFVQNGWPGTESLQRRSRLVQVVEDFEMKKISSMSSPSPVLGVVGIPDTNDIVGKRFFLLDQIRDPGNLGTIIRIADWFGLDGIICSPETVELYNPKVVQASMGSIFRVPVIYTTLPDWIRTHADIPVYAASLQGKNLHESSHSIHTGAILIGNESNGLTPELLSASTYQIRIPGGGAAESLNAAVAAGILAYGLLY